MTIGFFQGEIISPAFSKKTNDDSVKTDSTTTSTTTTEKDKDKTTDPSTTTTTDKTTKPKTTVKKEKSNTSNDNQTKTSLKKEKSNPPNDNQTEPTVQAFEAQDNTNQSKVDQTNTNQSIASLSLSNTNTNETDPIVCTSKDLLKCYFKLTTELTLAPGDKYSDFMLRITENPRHIADFPGSKSTVKYLLPGNYEVSLIYKGKNLEQYCVGEAKAGDSRICPISSPNLSYGEQILHVAESVRFANGSFATNPVVIVGEITVQGNNPIPAHFQLYSGDDEEGREVHLGLGKYSATISLPNDYKLAGTDGHCSGVMTKGKYDNCNFAVQQTAKPNQNGTTTPSSPPSSSNQHHTSTHTTKTIIKHESSVVENYIKIFITTNPEVLRQLQLQSQQQPTSTINSALIPLDTIQLCRQAGDQNCVLSANNFKILAANMTKDVFGSWTLNGLVQNNSTAPLNQIKAVLQLYNTTGNMVGSSSGIISPQNLTSTQNGIFFLQVHPSELAGIPKFYRISFDYQ